MKLLKTHRFTKEGKTMSESDSAKKAIYLQTLRYVALLLAILFGAGILFISYSKGLVFLGVVSGPAIIFFINCKNY